MKWKNLFFIQVFFFCILLIYNSEALAAASNQDILNTVLLKYKTIASTWQNPIKATASRLFWTLATISLTWTYGQLLFQKADIAAFFGETVKFIMFTGFFYWLLNSGPSIANSIIESMKSLGGIASRQYSGLEPSGIVDIGFKVVQQTWKAWSTSSPFLSFACTLVSIGILFVIAFVAINMLLQLCSAWILAYAGIFFLGFGGSRWTSDMALNYYKNVLSVAVSIFTMILLTSIGATIVEEYTSKVDDWLNMNELCVLFVIALTLLELVNKVPNMVASVATGGGIGSSGIGSFGGTAAALGAAATALTGAAAAIKGGVAASKAAGSAAGGGLAALKAACNAASQAQQMGTGAFSGMKPSSPSDGSLVRAMHGSPAFCAELGKSLGNSMKSAAKDKMNSMKEKASNAITNSAGGKLAASINKETAAKSEKHMESLQSMSESQAADAQTQQQAQNYVDFASGKMDLNDTQGEGGGSETPQNDSNSKSE